MVHGYLIGMVSPSQKRLPVILATGARDNYSRSSKSHITNLWFTMILMFTFHVSLSQVHALGHSL